MSLLANDPNFTISPNNIPNLEYITAIESMCPKLKKDQDRVILTADKGVALVVLDKEEYINKAQGLLSQPAYKEIPKDLTKRIKAQLITKLRRIKKDINLDEVCIRLCILQVVSHLSFMDYLKSTKQATP